MVGMDCKYVLEKMTRIPVEVDLASEFRYREPIIDEEVLVLVISQSGETADTLAAMREAKRLGARTLSIVNVVGSSIANESDDVIYTWAGPEIAVATTKAYSTQLAVVYLLAIYMADQLGRLSVKEYSDLAKTGSVIAVSIRRLKIKASYVISVVLRLLRQVYVEIVWVISTLLLQFHISGISREYLAVWTLSLI